MTSVVSSLSLLIAREVFLWMQCPARVFWLSPVLLLELKNFFNVLHSFGHDKFLGTAVLPVGLCPVGVWDREW